ncbi:hypothetical protein ST37_01805 (plasmid) [Vibrio sp. qd031]|uniref:hypothetical protein n=1 Tax=Vibrio sp. qd031 TaxID=1603038 RepID=UPI000A0F49AD|nr:hypothetical protein [Vibrio sp. qd031]ORT52528.1 hypothetical protein ST37_01805 [Vibrio sp. qd031]
MLNPINQREILAPYHQIVDLSNHPEFDENKLANSREKVARALAWVRAKKAQPKAKFNPASFTR